MKKKVKSRIKDLQSGIKDPLSRIQNPSSGPLILSLRGTCPQSKITMQEELKDPDTVSLVYDKRMNPELWIGNRRMDPESWIKDWIFDQEGVKVGTFGWQSRKWNQESESESRNLWLAIFHGCSLARAGRNRSERERKLFGFVRRKKNKFGI